MYAYAFAVSSRYIYNKYDQLALWWATQHLVPFESLTKAINSGIHFTHELAEHFDVTERFMATVIGLYRNKFDNILLNNLCSEPDFQGVFLKGGN